ncbi:NRDE family protein [Saccharicrinis aurantiacus]|uniref:NRDE family protein n=1 Tax=Saccharicrinis aurantiacus TaxID=1849719 RepID=UPI002491648A|nr:NRDE family protein [Saccharicrinis aurantiacus]
MCTVSYIPPFGDKSFILTSNRDEVDYRPTAAPKKHLIGNTELAFPKDQRAGGSWIAAKEEGRLCCLLNGGFISHSKQKHHTVSRGTIVVELTASNLSVKEFFKNRLLSNVEPFTMVTIEFSPAGAHSIYEFIWDGQLKHYQKLDKNKPYIWSSSTLYSSEHRALRQGWFNKFYNSTNKMLVPDDVYHFHAGTHTSNTAINTVMEGDNGLKTLSITQVFIRHNKLKMYYHNLVNNTKHKLTF